MERTHYSFKNLFIAYVFGYMPFGLFAAILSLTNVFPIYFNKHPYYGVTGFLVAILTIPFVGFIFGVINWVYLNLGVVLYNYIFKILKIGKKEND